MISPNPANVVKKKKGKISSFGTININTVISFTSPAPITFNMKSKKPTVSAHKAGKINTVWYFNKLSGMITTSNNKTIRLLIILERISLIDKRSNNRRVITTYTLISQFISSCYPLFSTALLTFPVRIEYLLINTFIKVSSPNKMATNNTATATAISPYSMDVVPRWLLCNLCKKKITDRCD